MWLPSRQKRFYKIAALSMIAIGSVLLAFSAWTILKPREMCQDTLVVTDGVDVLMRTQSPCIDPIYEYYGSSSDNFVFMALSICLMAFGGAIIGMIIRL